MRHKFSNIFLIGPMGSGKNTLGKQLSLLSGLQLYDSDSEIEQQTGVPISWIFEQEGEAGFRRRENEAILRLTKLQHIILATGGGCVVTPSNATALEKNGVVIHLQVSLAIQIERIASQKTKRPLFSANSSSEKLAALNKVREPLYQAIADFTYNTDHISPYVLAKQILQDWGQLKIENK
ncbi:MAG: hypothetical protein A3F10_07515 [Coxiella sp. RIFCSPHIGHO2_12_FULL_42_15]|nr:MAG: hypothetical protein A3F10_07515 [Coxiella sp. RIFCSPHIGHO2_12_FULL_42_15]